MNDLEKRSWEKVRSAGWERFLIRRIARGVLVCLLCGAAVDVVWWTFTRKDPGPLVAAAAGWALGGIFLGALGAKNEWDTNERGYHEDKPGH